MSYPSCRTFFRSCVVTGGAALLLATGRPAAAQTTTGNDGALHLTAGLDAPTVYVFRGLVQEREPKLTLFPAADVRVAFKANGDGALKSIDTNVGVWHSFNTGSSGSGEGGFETGESHYEEDFYVAFTVGTAGALSIGTTFTAYTSPNNSFTTVKELSVKVARTDWLAPYGLVAWELTDEGQVDGGASKGTYLELGAGPGFRLGGTTLTIPVKVGLSLGDYYELNGEDHAFGFFDVGGLLTVPIGTGRFGAWSLRGGVEVYALGDTAQSFNGDDQKSSRVVGSVGIGVSY